MLALNTIPAEVVNKVEVFDQQSERAQVTGFDDGNTTKTMNVVTREDKRNGQFGKLQAGYGTDDRYKLEGSWNKTNKEKQITLLGMSNNINQTNFSSSDLLGVGGRRGRGRGSNAQPQGITQTESFGLNFSNTLKKGKIEGSYFYDRKQRIDNSSANRETFFEGGNQFYNESSAYQSNNQNHRANLRLSYNFDDANSLTFTPRLSFQKNTSDDLTEAETFTIAEVLRDTSYEYRSDNIGYDINGDLLFRHKFSKSGRSFAFNVGSTISNSDRDNVYDDLLSENSLRYENDDSRTEIRTELTFTEPVGLSSQLQFNYELSNAVQGSDRNTFSNDGVAQEQLVGDLSSYFDNSFLTHSPSISLTNRSWQNFFNVSIAYQNAELNATQSFPSEYEIGRTFTAVLPRVMARINLGNNRDLFFRYRTSTNAPSGSQLQDLVDNSDPLFYTIGNPNLDQSYSHSLIARFRKSNVDKSSSFSSFIRMEASSGYISTGTFISRSDSTLSSNIELPANTALSKPLNLDGYLNLRNTTTLGILLSKFKTNVNISLGAGLVRIPGVSNNINNMSNNYNGTGRLTLSSNLSKDIDFTMFYSASYNEVNNSIQRNRNTSYLTQSIGGKLNLIFLKGTVFRSDWNYQAYDGISDDFNTRYLLWNMSLGKKFLENNRAEVSLTVFDLLNQNQNVSQTISSGYIEENRALVLKQYFMLTFTYQIRKFGNKSNRS